MPIRYRIAPIFGTQQLIRVTIAPIPEPLRAELVRLSHRRKRSRPESDSTGVECVTLASNVASVTTLSGTSSLSRARIVLNSETAFLNGETVGLPGETLVLIGETFVLGGGRAASTGERVVLKGERVVSMVDTTAPRTARFRVGSCTPRTFLVSFGLVSVTPGPIRDRRDSNAIRIALETVSHVLIDGRTVASVCRSLFAVGR